MEQMQIGLDRPEIKNFDYKFMIVGVYIFYSSASFCQLNQYTIVQNVLEPYYGIDSSKIHWTQLVFMINLLIFVYYAIKFVQHSGVRYASLFCVGVTCLAALMNLFCIPYVPKEYQFDFILLTQFVYGVAHVFVIIIPAKVVAVWYAAEKQNMACAYAICGNQLGLFMGAVFPMLFLDENNTNEEIKSGLFHMFISNFFFCVLAGLTVVFFYMSKPLHPPSYQQHEVRKHIKSSQTEAFCEIIVIKDFICLILLYGITCGMCNVFGIFQNMIFLNYFPGSLMSLLTITGLSYIFGGVVANCALGYQLDKKLQYKYYTFLIFGFLFLSYGTMAFFLEMRWYFLSCLMMMIFGCLSACTVNISIQYIIEVTYPAAEIIPVAVLQVVISVVTIAFQIIFNKLLSEKKFSTVHWLTIATFCLMTFGTYFLSSNLKRMLAKPKPESIPVPDELENS
ncbi:feline leukemia virus subgroup C receptor-related protein 1-like [Harmonia axyridis]|uniref:feline leukemia virus subgroup C receptor-related protein 1-like n=1 Tax=Harmonia axyridis TaxID=115357 RepID=UPI001E27698B|nr:feline leukemia virus subgroup C receptor-related protein 1-like [Harmonia axyridis]